MYIKIIRQIYEMFRVHQHMTDYFLLFGSIFFPLVHIQGVTMTLFRIA